MKSSNGRTLMVAMVEHKEFNYLYLGKLGQLGKMGFPDCTLL